MQDQESTISTRSETIRLATEIVSAYLGNNSLDAEKIPDVIRSVYGTLGALNETPAEGEQTKQKPAIPIKRSITDDYIICLEDGKKLKMLKRYLRSQYNMTPDDYRRKWGLPADYPMVAPNYAKRRSQFAKDIGLGRKTRKTTTRRKTKKTKSA